MGDRGPKPKKIINVDLEVSIDREGLVEVVGHDDLVAHLAVGQPGVACGLGRQVGGVVVVIGPGSRARR